MSVPTMENFTCSIRIFRDFSLDSASEGRSLHSEGRVFSRSMESRNKSFKVTREKNHCIYIPSIFPPKDQQSI